MKSVNWILVFLLFTGLIVITYAAFQYSYEGYQIATVSLPINDDACDDELPTGERFKTILKQSMRRYGCYYHVRYPHLPAEVLFNPVFQGNIKGNAININPLEGDNAEQTNAAECISANCTNMQRDTLRDAHATIEADPIDFESADLNE